MHFWRILAVLTMAAPMVVAAQNKSKKHHEVPAVFAQAHFVYVQAQDGDVTKASLYPEDRQAISEMQEALREWGRYALTTDRKQAELVFMVRKGRTFGEQTRGGVSVGQRPPTPSGQPRQPGLPPDDQGTGAGVGTEMGPGDDILQVYTTNPDGKLVGPIWRQQMPEGLDGPSVPLLRQLRVAVEQAYPKEPAPKQQP